MKSYTCDYCENGMETYAIAIKGILSPDSAWPKHFCGVRCFWNWIDAEIHERDVQAHLDKPPKQPRTMRP